MVKLTNNMIQKIKNNQISILDLQCNFLKNFFV